MVTRIDRLAGYVTDGMPGPEQLVEVLCADHIGTYVLPFPCRYEDGSWRNGGTGEQIEAKVIGWRSRREQGGSPQPQRVTGRTEQPWPDA
jgi:hypothetical protein